MYRYNIDFDVLTEEFITEDDFYSLIKLLIKPYTDLNNVQDLKVYYGGEVYNNE